MGRVVPGARLAARPGIADRPTHSEVSREHHEPADRDGGNTIEGLAGDQVVSRKT